MNGKVSFISDIIIWGLFYQKITRWVKFNVFSYIGSKLSEKPTKAINNWLAITQNVHRKMESHSTIPIALTPLLSMPEGIIYMRNTPFSFALSLHCKFIEFSFFFSTFFCSFNNHMRNTHTDGWIGLKNEKIVKHERELYKKVRNEVKGWEACALFQN